MRCVDKIGPSRPGRSTALINRIDLDSQSTHGITSNVVPVLMTTGVPEERNGRWNSVDDPTPRVK